MSLNAMLKSNIEIPYTFSRDNVSLDFDKQNHTYHQIARKARGPRKVYGERWWCTNGARGSNLCRYLRRGPVSRVRGRKGVVRSGRTSVGRRWWRSTAGGRWTVMRSKLPGMELIVVVRPPPGAAENRAADKGRVRAQDKLYALSKHNWKLSSGWSPDRVVRLSRKNRTPLRVRERICIHTLTHHALSRR